MHRPIIGSKTAINAKLYWYPEIGHSKQIGPEFSSHTYDYISKTSLERDTSYLDGVISSFNVNTFKGRIYVFEEKRPIPFELGVDARDRTSMYRVTSSLRANARNKNLTSGNIQLKGRRLVTSTGRLKAIVVTEVGEPENA